MPTYAYECRDCGHAFEEFQSITAGPLRKCPGCGRLKLQRLIGPGAAVIFKGGGFYETDYRSKSYQADQKADQKGDKDGQDKTTEGGAKTSKDAGKPATDKKKTEDS